MLTRIGGAALAAGVLAVSALGETPVVRKPPAPIKLPSTTSTAPGVSPAVRNAIVSPNYDMLGLKALRDKPRAYYEGEGAWEDWNPPAALLAANDCSQLKLEWSLEGDKVVQTITGLGIVTKTPVSAIKRVDSFLPVVPVYEVVYDEAGHAPWTFTVHPNDVLVSVKNVPSGEPAPAEPAYVAYPPCG